MEKLITAYLFQCKTCPLPGFGTLSIATGNAQGDFVNKQLLPPKPEISFNTKETPADELVDFIAVSNGLAPMQAIEQLGNFCTGLKQQLNTENEAIINGTGKLFLDKAGNLNFTPTKLDDIFLMPVANERAIHNKAEHTMLVGYKETTNTEMEAYFAETTIRKNYWWVWAILIAVAAIGLILYYLNLSLSSPLFGNAGTLPL